MNFHVAGWEDSDGNRHLGEPTELDDVIGTWVHVTDPDDPEFEKYFWAWVTGPFDDWAEWYVYIGAIMEMYGMSLSE